MVTTLTLPAQFAGVTPSASLDRGCRAITWTLTEPGELHRNTYAFAWVEVVERQPWRGEPLWLSATRRRTDTSYSREPFTTKARETLHAEIVPQLARSFGDLWLALHRTRTAATGETTRRGEALAEWCRQADELAELHAAGLLTFRPVDVPAVRANFGRCGVGVRIWNHHGIDTEDAVASAHLEGQQVGWMLRTGTLAPLIDPTGDTR